MLSGEVLQVASPTSVQVVGSESAGKPSVLGGPIATNNGVVYLIDGILSVKAVESEYVPHSLLLLLLPRGRCVLTRRLISSPIAAMVSPTRRSASS
jgi:hypothetical protein